MLLNSIQIYYIQNKNRIQRLLVGIGVAKPYRWLINGDDTHVLPDPRPRETGHRQIPFLS